MYDYLKCEVPLPDGFVSAAFQTKDFECNCGSVHEIRVDGSLWLDNGHFEDRPREEKPYPDAAPGSKEYLFGAWKWVHKLEHAADYHGFVNFYDFTDDGEWHEYNAKFTDGKLAGIEVVSSPKQINQGADQRGGEDADGEPGGDAAHAPR